MTDRRLRRLGLAAGAAGLLMLAALLALAPGSDDDQAGETTLVGDGYSFRYPQTWTSIAGVPFPVAERMGIAEIGDHVVGINQSNWIASFSFARSGDTPVSASNVMAFAPTMRRTFDALAAETPQGRIESPPSAIEVGSLPGLRLRFSYRSLSGLDNRQEIVQLWGAERAYVITCNYSPTVDAEVTAACDRAFETFLEVD
jgi:hypothetical protein